MDANVDSLPLPEKELERLLEESAPAIKQHAAIIHAEADFLCSGVYATSCGYLGILTAGHCAREFVTKRAALTIAEEPHQLFVTPDAFEEVPVGYEPESKEPDLSFVIIRDKSLLLTILESELGFYNLDSRMGELREILTAGTFNRITWSVEGNPGKRETVATRIVNGREARVTTTTAALLLGSLKEWEFRGEFDYVTLLLGSGVEEYPDCYKGVSGGGIWYQRLIQANGIYTVEPMLAGIACWQGPEFFKKPYTGRPIHGHGWISIYAHVRKALADKAVLERGIK